MRAGVQVGAAAGEGEVAGGWGDVIEGGVAVKMINWRQSHPNFLNDPYKFSFHIVMPLTGSVPIVMTLTSYVATQ